MSEQAPAVEIPAEDVYAAAEERAVRTTRALILAEAHVRTLERRVALLEGELQRVACERDELLEQDEPEPCDHTGPGSPCDWNRCEQQGGEVTHDGTADERGAAAGGEVGFPHAVHD